MTPPLTRRGFFMDCMKTLLHIGFGPKRKDKTTRGFNTEAWSEVRLDIDPSVEPDVIGTMTDMSAVASESVDAIFSSHNIEHLYPHEVPVALKEFLRVLKPEGFAVITCPDLQSVCALVAQDKLTDAAYSAPAGPKRHWTYFTVTVRRWLRGIFTWRTAVGLRRKRSMGP